MKKMFSLLGLVAALLLSASASAQEFDWLRTVMPGHGPSGQGGLPQTMTVDRHGNAYTFSRMTNGYTVNGLPPTALASEFNVVLLAFDSASNLRWQHYIGHDDTEFKITAATTDAAGNLYAAGYHYNFHSTDDTLHLDGQPLITTAFATDYYLFKWRPDGTLAWMSRGGGRGSRSPSAIAVDATGALYVSGTVTGHWSGFMTFGGLTLPVSSGAVVAFCARFRADNGVAQWVKVSDVNPSGYARATSVATDGRGLVHLWVKGMWGTPISWEGHPVSANGVGSVLTINGSNGQFRRALVGNAVNLTQTTNSLQWNATLATDAANHLYVAGPYIDSTQLGGAVFPAQRSRPIGANTIGVACFDSAGTALWARSLKAPADTCDLRAGSAATNSVGLTVGLGGVYVAGVYSGALTLGGAVGRLPYGYSIGVVVRLAAATGVAEWARTISGTNTAGAGAGRVGVSAGGAVTVIGGSISTVLHAGPLTQVGTGTGMNAQGFVYLAHLATAYNRVDGRVYVDANADGTYSAGLDRPMSAILTTTPATTTSFLSADAAQGGQYSGTFPAGSYALALAQVPRYHTLASAATRTVTFSGTGTVRPGEDFVLLPIPNQQDLQVFLTPVGRARPGFAVSYRLTCRNVGTVAIAAPALHLTFDPLLAYVSSSHPATPSSGSLLWNLSALAPGETRQVDALFQLAITAPLGHLLTATATLDPTSGDLTPADNVEAATLTVTNSFDPNDISVNYATLTLPQVQTATRPLDYVIRFQNRGTDTAFTVVLRDTLPASLLNLGTLDVLAVSHSCSWRLGAGGVLTISFPNIQLPPAGSNTLTSLGYVRFRVVPWITLNVGALIPNQANIHFDFNAPISTNTALTTVVSPTGLAAGADALTGGAWPNPTTDVLHVAIARPAGTPLVLALADALGRVVRTAAVPATAPGAPHTFDLHGLAPGLYVVRATTPAGTWSQRVVVQ